MEQQLITVLSDTILPMAERLDTDHLVLPGGVGKSPFGVYPPDPQLPPAQRGEDLQSKQPIAYMSHPRSVEWVFGFSGKAELALDGQRYELTEGCLGIIPPHALHMERILHREQGYHLIWFCVYLDKSRISVHSSSYSGGSLFQLVPGAQIEKCPSLCGLLLRAAEEALRRETAWEHLVRATAIEVVVKAIRHFKAHGLGQTAKTQQSSVVEFAKAYIHSHFTEPLTLDGIAQKVFLSPNYFTSLFSMKAGTTVFDYIQQVRLAEAKRLLSESGLPVHEVSNQVGFGTRSHFARSFKRQFGCSPREFRRRVHIES